MPRHTTQTKKGSVQPHFCALRKSGAGFTLIEIILYLTLTTIMISILGGIGVNVLLSNAKAHAREEVGYNAHFVFEKIERVIHEAESITGPTGNATSSTLTLTMSDAEKDPTVVTVTEGVVTITKGIGPALALTASEVTVTDLTFSDVSFPGMSPSVRIEMTIEAFNPEGRKAYEARETLYTTVNLRKTP